MSRVTFSVVSSFAFTHLGCFSLLLCRCRLILLFTRRSFPPVNVLVVTIYTHPHFRVHCGFLCSLLFCVCWTVSCFTYCPLDTVPLSAHSVLSIPSSGVHFTLSSPCHFLFTASGFPFCLRFALRIPPVSPFIFSLLLGYCRCLYLLLLSLLKHFLERERCKPLSTSCHFIPSVVIVLERECG